MTDVMKIGVEIALAGSIMQGLEAISAKLLGINARVKEVEGGFARWAVAIGGAAALIGAEKIAVGLEKAVKAGGDLVKQQSLLKSMGGFSDRDVLSTTLAAQRATTQVIGTTIAENLKGMRELVGVMPNLKEAQEGYVPVMRAAKVLESMTGTPAEKSLQTLAKAIELRGGGINPRTGQLDPERFKDEADAARAAIVASGGLVNSHQLLGLMQQAGPAARAVESADAFYKMILTSMMDMGGFRAGTALTALGRQLLGGKMTKATAENMESDGLLVHGKWHKSGGGVVVDKGGVTNEEVLREPDGGVLKWLNDTLLPAFAARGITSGPDVQRELYKDFGTETARRLAGLFIQNKDQIARDANLYENARHHDSYKDVAGGDYEANMKNLQDAWTNLMQAFGAPLVKPAISAMQSLAGLANSFAGWELIHPERVKLIGEALAGLAAALAVFGAGAITAALIAFAPGGAVVAAMAGVAAGLGVLAAFNWSSLEPVKNAIEGFAKGMVAAGKVFIEGAKGLGDAIKAIADTIPAMISAAKSAMSEVAKALSSAIAAIPGQVMGAISAMASGIASAISGAISGIAGKIGAAIKGLGGGGAPAGTGESGGGAFTPGAYHPSGGGGRIGQTAYAAPASRQVALNFTHTTNLDGKQIAKNSSQHMVAMLTHPRQSPAHDPGNYYSSGDYGFATG